MKMAGFSGERALTLHGHHLSTGTTAFTDLWPTEKESKTLGLQKGLSKTFKEIFYWRITDVYNHILQSMLRNDFFRIPPRNSYTVEEHITLQPFICFGRNTFELVHQFTNESKFMLCVYQHACFKYYCWNSLNVFYINSDTFFVPACIIFACLHFYNLVSINYKTFD